MNNMKLDLQQISLLYDSMKEVYISYREKCDKCSDTYESVSIELEELKRYVSYLEGEKSKDSFVFSPRGVVGKNAYMNDDGKGYVIDNVHIEQKQEELKQLEDKAASVERELKSYQSLVDLLNQSMNIFFSLKKSISSDDGNNQHDLYRVIVSGNQLFLNSFKDEMQDSLSYISHTMKMISSYVDNDPMRAKLELCKLEESLHDIMNRFNSKELLLQPYPYELTVNKEFEDLRELFHQFYPHCKVTLRIENKVVIDSYLTRILLYLFVKELMIQSASAYDVNDIQISISSSEVCITSTGKMLYDFFHNKESLQIKDKIKLLDENYEFLFDKNKNCSSLKLTL